MREIYNKYFHIPENGILSEKVFFARIAVSVVCIVLCMAALGFNAYAYFTSDVISANNTLKAASYTFEEFEYNRIAEQTSSQTSSVAETDGVTKGQNFGEFTLAPGKYEFKLTKAGNAKTGYGMIKVQKEGEEDIFLFTRQIGGVKDSNNNEILYRVITIQVAQETNITITPCWGTYSSDGIDDENNMIVVDFSQKTDDKKVAIAPKVSTISNVTETVTTQTPAASTATQTTTSTTETGTATNSGETTAQQTTPQQTTTPETNTENITEEKDSGSEDDSGQNTN